MGSSDEQKSSFSLHTKLSLLSIFVGGLFLIAVFATLFVTREITVPIVIAIMLNFLLAPMVDQLKKIHIPSYIGAALLIALFFFFTGLIFFKTFTYTANWLATSPHNFPIALHKFENLIQPIHRPITNLLRIKQKIEETTQVVTTSKQKTISVENSRLFESIFNNTQSFLFGMMLIVLLLYFLLISENFFLKKLIEALPNLEKKKDILVMMHLIQEQISLFLMLRVATGIMVALFTALILYALQMPNAIIWGLVAGLLQFIPYFGILLGAIAITFTAILTFDNIWHIILIPAGFFLVDLLIDNIIFPILLSKKLVLHPVIILISVFFWGWLWGIPGTLIAVPIISIIKIICQNIESLEPYSKFLGE